MATLIRHRKTRIITLDVGDDLHEHCKPKDIALVPDPGDGGPISSAKTAQSNATISHLLPIMRRCGRPRPPRNSTRNKS